MNGTKLRWLVLIGSITIVLSSLTPPSAVSTRTTGGDAVNLDSQAHIRVIEFFEPGLGTLVRAGQRTYLVTHDHWGLLDDLARVEIRDAYDRLLLTISADRFPSLIQLRDGGTLILAGLELAPLSAGISQESAGRGAAQTISGAILVDRDQVAVGDVVLIPNKDDQDPSRLLVEAAVVQAIETVDGVPVYTCHTRNGGAIVKGDSGGGVFHNGLLIANTLGTQKAIDWRLWTWQSFPPDPTPTGVHFAARLPLP